MVLLVGKQELFGTQQGSLDVFQVPDESFLLSSMDIYLAGERQLPFRGGTKTHPQNLRGGGGGQYSFCLTKGYTKNGHRAQAGVNCNK